VGTENILFSRVWVGELDSSKWVNNARAVAATAGDGESVVSNWKRLTTVVRAFRREMRCAR
jgi:hypothetical protein